MRQSSPFSFYRLLLISFCFTPPDVFSIPSPDNEADCTNADSFSAAALNHFPYKRPWSLCVYIEFALKRESAGRRWRSRSDRMTS